MSISSEITRIQTARNTIRTKLVELGLAENTATLDVCANAIEDITNRGSVSATVTEGDTYTIPKGYHSGSGTVSGVAGGGNYSLQSKTVTPTKKQQNITPDSGYYGLSDVTVGMIPENFQDVSSVDATAADVLANKKIVSSNGTLTTGTMPNNGDVSATLHTTATSYTIPKGYHNGSGKVVINTATKSVTPTKAAQTVTPAAGAVLSSVTVNAIPGNFADVSDVTAAAANVLAGKTVAVPKTDSSGNVTGHEIVEGTMANRGAVTQALDYSTTSYTIPAGYHNGAGKVSITLEERNITPTKSSQVITTPAGKVLGKVTVAAIPAAYITTTDATAGAAHILDDKTAYVNGVKVEGTMPNKGAFAGNIDGLTTTFLTIPAGYHNGQGAIGLTNDIETALAAI